MFQVLCYNNARATLKTIFRIKDHSYTKLVSHICYVMDKAFYPTVCSSPISHTMIMKYITLHKKMQYACPFIF